MTRRLILPAVLAAATALVVLLAWQNRHLREERRELRLQALGPYPGLIVPTVKAPDLAGDSLVLGETSGKRQVLLAFTTTCPFCLASLPAWHKIAAAAQKTSTEIEVYGVSLDSLRQTRSYVAEHGITYPVVLLSAKAPALFRVQNVPTILVLDQYGRTLYGRVGALESPAAIDSVLAVIDGGKVAQKSAHGVGPINNGRLP